MREVIPGHLYELANRVVTNDVHVGSSQILRFVQMEPGEMHSGITTQEVLRVLIARNQYVEERLSHPNNKRILECLRMALVLHEGRALEQKTLKGELFPEDAVIGDDGHFMLKED